ncbi:5650_t:CDS:2 [Dentiscutata erythropus]|uniref:5650_t:CDS:1 n=1 Tax=Dentiscutata erythropus TaxID=1348616 RepID=A0A9N9EQN3_9GLOM|nr:5650_t:CDS:2 [Dentiscutata erythropus]
MATYKQKPVRPQTHYASSDSEEASGSDQEWVVFHGDRSSSKSFDRKIGIPSSDDDWHVLSDNLSPTEEGLIVSESNSEFASDYDSEPDQVQEHSEDLVNQDYIPQIPSRDSVENFNETLSDIDFTPNEKNNSPEFEENHKSEATNPSITGADIFDYKTQSQNENISENRGRTLGSARDSLMSKLRNVFRIEEEVVSIIEREQPPQVYQRLGESASANAKFGLGDLGMMNPIKSLANVNNEGINDHSENKQERFSQLSTIDNMPITYTRLSSGNASIITRLGSRPNMPKDPMAVKFAPTIPKDTINNILTNNNINSSHDNQATSNSGRTSQSDTNSLLSTVWTTFRRITNNIIISSDSESSHNDNIPYPSILSLGSSSRTHQSGLASIITESGESYYAYDTCYPPFGNHLTLSDLCPPLYNHRPSTTTAAPHACSGSSIPSSNAARKLLTPVSSSASLQSFISRGGSDCGLESGRERGTSLEVPLVM